MSKYKNLMCLLASLVILALLGAACAQPSPVVVEKEVPVEVEKEVLIE